MNQPLISTEEFDAPTESMQSSASAPSAPPAYNDEFKPPIHNPPPYNSQMTEQSVQMAQPPSYPTQSPYAQAYAQQHYMSEMAAAPPPQIVTERIYVGNVPVGRDPVTTTCPNCNARIKSKTTKNTHGSAHLWCLCMLSFFCWCCSCLPYCMKSFSTIHHHCPNCNAYLGASVS